MCSTHCVPYTIYLTHDDFLGDYCSDVGCALRLSNVDLCEYIYECEAISIAVIV